MFVDAKSIDKAAKALFDYVFTSCKNIDSSYLWEKVPHEVREGFRKEVKIVIDAMD